MKHLYPPVDILTDDNDILRQKSEPVTEFNDELEHLVHTMISSMMERRGVGLAAVQIGQLKRVIIVRLSTASVLCMVNPVYLRQGNRFVTEREGCLSISPVKWREVSRPAKCEIQYQDMQGNTHVMNMSGDTARRAQHEMDHLDGILITDKPPVK